MFRPIPLPASLVAAAILVAGCSAPEPVVSGITVRAFDVLADTAVILTDDPQPVLAFVPLRPGDGAPSPGTARTVARVVTLPSWGRYVTHLRVAGDRMFLGGEMGGLAVLDADGTRLSALEIRRDVPRAFAPVPSGLVYYASSRYELFHTESTGPGNQGARPFLRRPEPEAPKVSRARSGPGLDPVMVVDRAGTLHRFSNRSGILTSHDARGELVATTRLPEPVLARAIPGTRSSVGRAGGPLATGLRLGCDGEVVLTLADSRGTVVQLHPGEGRAEVVGAIGRGRRGPDHGSGSGRVATLCGGRVLAP